ncbi:MAG: 3-hydroxyacyl-CoA dehydrogenase [Gammaproteobacteria bacterium]|nr:3-hydroxyacyl-CoA dehydrogenase [Gammaproteobacteria bacterium]
MKIQGSTFLVTGGASGLGAATARRLVKLGARVLIADLGENAGRQLAHELGDNAWFEKVDVTSEADVQRAVVATLDHYRALHGVVNCAGIAVGEKVVGKEGPHALASFARCININLVGTFNVLRLAAEAMSKQPANEEGERGVIVNTASVAAFDGQIGQAAYAASKAGVVGMTLPVARELARYGIRCVTVAPGLFETPMMAGLPKDVQDSLGKTVPFPARLGRPAEFALLAQQVIENPMLNGETIRLDGALRMAPK